MGMYSSTTKQETKIPEKTEDEKALDAMMIDVILPSYMESIGYSMKRNDTVTYKNPEKVKSLEAQRDSLNSQISSAKSSGKDASKLQSELSQIESQLDTEYANKTTDVSYDYELNETGQMMKEINEKAVNYQSESMDIFMDTYRKFSSGDYSITDAQKELINTQLGTVRDAVFAMFDEAEKTADETGVSINEAIDNYANEINKTGLSVGAALGAIEDRIKLNKEGLLAGISEEEKRVGDTGLAVKSALQGVMDEINKTGEQTKALYEDLFETKKILVENQMKDVYDQNQRKVADRAALLGRSPMDPQFQNELLDNLQKNIKTAQLELSAQESEALAGLEERTGQRREQLKMQMAAFEESQGGKMEQLGAKRTEVENQTGQQLTDVAGQKAQLAQRQGEALEGAAASRADVASQVGQAKQNIALSKAGLETELQQTGMNLAQQYGVGIPASQIGLGIDIAGFGQATQAQQAAIQSGALGSTNAISSRMLQERMAQPTTTTTQNPGFGNVLTGLIGAGLSGAGALMGGIGAMK